MSTPARGYTWPPAAVGNTLALRHGATSPREVQPLAEGFHAAIIEAAPWTSSPAFAGTVQSWAWAEGQALLLRRWLDENGMLDGEDEERSAARLLDRIEGRLAKLRDQLGLNPTAAMKVLSQAADLAAATGDDEGLAALQAEGARILAAQGLTKEGSDA